MKNSELVDQYIAQFSPEVQKALGEVRDVIQKTAPEAEETIAYRMPAYKLNGKPLVYFAAFKNHVGFYPLPDGIEKFQVDLKKYKHSKGSIQFPLSELMPLELVEQIVKYRVNSLKDSK